MPPKPPKPKSKPSQPKVIKRGRSKLGTFISWMAKAIVLALILSVFWVLSYRWINPPFTEIMLERFWEQHAETGRWKWTGPSWVDQDEISKSYFRAMIAGEDQRFAEHWGFDLDAIQAAAKWNRKHKRKRGASTLTQQVAKNVFLWENRSWLRKGLEAWFTVWIELLWSKERILEVHANIAEISPWTFGVQDNARKWFGKDAKNLNPREAALLVAALPKPRTFNARKPSGFYLQKQRFILRNMNSVDLPD